MQKKKQLQRLTRRRTLRALRPCKPLATVLALGVLSACASSTMMAGQAGMTHDTSLGKVLVDSTGMTLYTYDKDEPGRSHCNGLCATFWPPVSARADVAQPNGFNVITRDSGARQWTYHGDPLYTYVKDNKPGDVVGDGVDGVWHAAKP